MHGTVERRAFLAAAAAAGAAAVARRVGTEADATDDVAAVIIALSRGDGGVAHVQRVAVAGPQGIAGTLPVSADELRDLRGAMASSDFSALRARGLTVANRRFVLTHDDADDGGVYLHAVRRGGEFLTARACGDHLVVATGAPDMTLGRAAEAVYRYAKTSYMTVRKGG